MMDAIRGLLSSKKVIASIAGGLMALGAMLGLSEELAGPIAQGVIALTLTLVGGIAAQDLGKERAKIEAESFAQTEAAIALMSDSAPE